MSGLPRTTIDKLEAARRQLSCAIRLVFKQEDSLSIHTLAQASFRLLYDLYPYRRDDRFDQRLDELIQKVGWRNWSKVPNFLKHADKDPEATLHSHVPEEVEPILGMACTLHHRLAGYMTPEMRAFDAWMHILNPDVFGLPADDDPDFDVMFRESVRMLKSSDRIAQLSLGDTLIRFYQEHPQVGGFGAPRGPGWSDCLSAGTEDEVPSGEAK